MGGVQGCLTGRRGRGGSGLGQTVEVKLGLGVASYDVYNQFYELVLHRYPGAYQPMDTAYDDEGFPQAYLIYALLIAATKDGTWLQFAQTAPRLMQAWLIELDRQSVVLGKSVSVRVDLGGRRIIKKQNRKNIKMNNT